MSTVKSVRTFEKTKAWISLILMIHVKFTPPTLRKNLLLVKSTLRSEKANPEMVLNP